MLERVGYVLVLLMALLQTFFAAYAYLDPMGFVEIRGTDLVSSKDLDWVKIYASRTLFVALIVGFLLYLRDYKNLVWLSLFGTVMPITDAILAYQAGASQEIVIRHVATIIYLIITFVILKTVVSKQRAVV